jgi:hypothetical protein
VPDTSNTVQILLQIRAENQAALTELQAQIAALKAEVAGLGTVGATAATGLGAVEKAATSSVGGVAASKAAIMSHAEILAAWQAEFGKTEKSLINFGGQATKLGALSDNLSQQLLNAARAAAPVAVATNAVAQSLVAGTAATQALAQGTTAATQATGAFAQGAATASTAATALTQGTATATAATGALAQGAATATTGVRTIGTAAAQTRVNASALARSVDQMASGFVRAIPGAGGLAGEIRGVGMGAIGAAGQVGILNTVLIGAGIAGVLAFTAALAGIVTKGIEVQKTLQDLGSGVQGTLKSNTDFSQSQIGAAGAQSIIAITNAAKEARVPITDLSKAFDQVFPSASRANTSIQGLATVLAKLISEEDNLHIPSAKIATDLEQIFNGSVKNTNQLAEQLGVTKEMAAAWREAGTTTDELTAKTNSFAEANTSSTESISRAQQTVVAAFQQLADAATRDTVQPVTKALHDLADALNDPANAAGVSFIIAQLERLVAYAGTVISAMQAVGKAIVNALQAAASFASSLPLGEGEGSTGGGDTGGHPSTGLQAGGSGDGSIDLSGVVVQGTGTRPAIGASGGRGGGRGGGAGPSQDKLDQQQIAEIQSELNAKTEEYHSLIEQNNAAHQLGKTTLAQENAANLEATNTYITGINASIQKLQAMKAAVQAVADAHGGVNVAEQKQLNNLDQMIAKMRLVQAQAEVKNLDNSWIGQWDKGLRKFSDDLLLTGAKAEATFRQITDVGISSVSNALTGLITGSKNWADAFKQAGASIIQTLIKVELQNLVGLALQQSADAAARLESARTAAAGAYSSAAQIPYIGWIIAPFAAAAAFAAVEAFAGGGIVPGQPSNSDNRMAMVASGEGIVTSRAVQQYGAAHIHALNAGTFALGGIIPTFTPSFATGGIVGSFGAQGGGGTASKGISVNNFFDKNDLLQHMISHPDLTHHIVDTMRKNRFALKV